MPGSDLQIELVRATARAAVRRSAGQADGTAATDTLPSLIGRGPDWDRVQRLAEFHGTVPLLERGLSLLPEGTVPTTVQQALRDRCRDIAARNLLLSGRLTQACAALEQTGIPVLAIKGPTLALLAYGNLSLRQFNDIDLLVPPAEFDRALETLRGLGYGFAHRITPSQRIHSLRANCQLSLRNAQGTQVELHTRLTYAAYYFPLEFDALWSRRQSVPLHDQAINTLGSEDLLLYVAVHGTKHGWPCLEWVIDLVQLVARHRTADWLHLLQYATALHCRRILLLSLALARETLGVDLPAAVAHGFSGDRVALRLAVERSRRLLSANSTESGFSIARFRLRSRERLRDGVSYLWASVFSAQKRDWQVFNLPSGLEFLYAIARPLRLALEHWRPTDRRR